MRLRYDPHQIFEPSKRAAGLYARQKLLDQSDIAAWQQNFKQTVAALYVRRSADRSWSNDQPEWNTFLVVYALRNKARI